MNIFFEKLSENLWQVSVQVSILIAIIWLVSLLVKKASAEFRYLLWCIVLVRLCIPVEFNLPFIPELPTLKSEKLSALNYLANSHELINKQLSTQLLSQSATAINSTISSVIAQSNQKAITVSNKAESAKVDFRVIALLAWISGAAFILLVTLCRNLILFRKLNKCPAVEREDANLLIENLCRRLRIRQNVSLHYMDTSVFSGPVASGIIKPKIFLPPVMADTWPEHNLEPVLLHELAHIRRYDSFINIVQMLVHTVYFFHPLVWLVNHKIHGLREDVCDDMAVRYLEGEKKRYSTSILNVVEILHDKRSYGLTGFGFAEVKSSLGKRIKRILNENYRINQRLSLLSFMGLTLIAMLGIAAASSHKPENAGIASGHKTEKAEIKSGNKSENNLGNMKTTPKKIPDLIEQVPKKWIQVSIDEKGEYEIDGFLKTDYKNIENILKEIIIKTKRNDILITTAENTPIKYFSYLTDISVKCGMNGISHKKTPLEMEKK